MGKLTTAKFQPQYSQYIERTDAGAVFEASAPLRAERVNLLAEQPLGVTAIADRLDPYKGQIREACKKMQEYGVLDRNKIYFFIKSVFNIHFSSHSSYSSHPFLRTLNKKNVKVRYLRISLPPLLTPLPLRLVHIVH